MSEIKTRFAPSPTGYVHVGSLRTALYNYLFAKKHGGKFILRVEDTDQNRFVEGAVENLLRTLNWCALEYDLGPEKGMDGDLYFQSNRTEIYKQHVQQLINAGYAYRCFCGTDRLDELRKTQEAQNLPIKYDGMCRSISRQDSEHKAQNQPYVIRMKVPDTGETVVEDVIRGTVTFKNEVIDDQVLIKSDGYPTYHLANVVDDHLMGISHVIRGEEWLPSTPKHVLLYEYFKWQKPVFAHLPLLLNPDRSKLSKRQGDVAVEDYKAKGYLPEALLNFVALLGWNKGDDQEIFSLQELVKDFSLEKVGKAGAVFNTEKLDWINSQYIRSMPVESYLKKAIDFLTKNNVNPENRDLLEKSVLAVREKITTLAELPEKTAIFFTDAIADYSKVALELIRLPQSQLIFEKMLSELNNFEEMNIDSFKQLMKTVQTETGVKGKDLWMPVRAALTGSTEGPELPVVIDLFGISKMTRLLQAAIKN